MSAAASEDRRQDRTGRTAGAADSPGAGATGPSRRRVVGWLGGLVALSALSGCTPLRLLLRIYPEEFADGTERVDRVLRAFVTTVVPGTEPDAPDLARLHQDPDYPFARRAGYFAWDLCRRAGSAYGAPFDELSLPRRTAVVRAGLEGDALTRRLYAGAIFLAQISCYAGIYDDRRGCPLIDFDGAGPPPPRAVVSYPRPSRFLAPAMGRAGNLP